MTFRIGRRLGVLAAALVAPAVALAACLAHWQASAQRDAAVAMRDDGAAAYTLVVVEPGRAVRFADDDALSVFKRVFSAARGTMVVHVGVRVDAVGSDVLAAFVAPDHFDALPPWSSVGTPFTTADVESDPMIAAVSASLARRIAGDGAVIGRVVVVGDAIVRIVAVLPDTYSLIPGRRTDIVVPDRLLGRALFGQDVPMSALATTGIDLRDARATFVRLPATRDVAAGLAVATARLRAAGALSPDAALRLVDGIHVDVERWLVQQDRFVTASILVATLALLAVFNVAWAGAHVAARMRGQFATRIMLGATMARLRIDTLSGVARAATLAGIVAAALASLFPPIAEAVLATSLPDPSLITSLLAGAVTAIVVAMTAGVVMTRVLGAPSASASGAAIVALACQLGAAIIVLWLTLSAVASLSAQRDWVRQLDRDGTWVARLVPRSAEAPDVLANFLRERRVSPGVLRQALADALGRDRPFTIVGGDPFAAWSYAERLTTPAGYVAPSRRGGTDVVGVDDAYFAVMPHRWRAGGPWRAATSDAVVISASVAIAAFGRPDVAGRLLQRPSVGPQAARTFTVAGVVDDPIDVADPRVRRPLIYVPLASTGFGELVVVGRGGRGDHAAIAGALDGIPAALGIPGRFAAPLSAAVEVRAAAPFEQARITLLVACAIAAAIVVVLGIAISTLQSIHAQARRIAICSALGASRTRVILSVARPTASIAIAAALLSGIIAPVVVATLGGAAAAGTTPDAHGLIMATVAAVALTLLTALVAASRAARIDPAGLLRASGA